MSGRFNLLACAGPDRLERVLLLGDAVARRGGGVVLLTYTPGQALRRIFYPLEVVVRRDDELSMELVRLEALASSRDAMLLLDDPRVTEEHVGAVRLLADQVAVARFGPRLLGGAAGELAIDPYAWPLGAPVPAAAPRPGRRPAPPQCTGLDFLPLHPHLTTLRERHRPAVPDQVARVTVACRGDDLAGRVLLALSVWRPTLQVTVLWPKEAERSPGRAFLDDVVRDSRHDVTIRPLLPHPHLGESLGADLCIVDDVDSASSAAYLGSPVLGISVDDEAARCMEALARAGLLIHLRRVGPDDPPPPLLGDLLWTLCADPGRRAAMAAAGRRLLDGHGADRIASRLFHLYTARHPSC